MLGSILLAWGLAAAPPAAAQVTDTATARRMMEERLGRSVSQEEILEQIRGSGLSRSEARARLGAMGYDPAIVDVYYDLLEEEQAASAGAGAGDFARALESLRRAPRVDLSRQDTAGAASREPRDTTRSTAELPLFGKDLFSRSTTEFQPLQYGPVDESYRLGPGDEIQLILTGGVEAAYSLEVNRQGVVVIPDVGQVSVGGMTLGQLDTALRQQVGRVYSGAQGPNPSIQVQASLGRLRTNQVYIVGEVERPGAYQVSAVSTVFNALYRAGGPKRTGSFRRIQVWRGPSVVSQIDLYDYLTTGDSRGDIRLENGDRIHVPLPGPRVTVRGAVGRPAIYELTMGEDLFDLIRYAGGVSAEAVVRRIQIDRILPPVERTPGRDRVLVDVDLASLLAGDRRVPIRDGDEVTVFAVSGDRRNRVSLFGDVRRPGVYQWSPGLTLHELLERADGLAESAFLTRAHVFRLDQETGERWLVPVGPPESEGAAYGAGVRLADGDSIVIYSQEELRTPRLVHIAGYVKQPGVYDLAEGMSLEDLILAAGGFTEGAHTRTVEVARPSPGAVRQDTMAQVLNVPLVAAGASGMSGSAEMPQWAPGASRFALQHNDRVFVRKAPGHDAPRTVTVVGEVAFPGEYVLSQRNERLTDILARAGGVTRDGHVPGIRIVRDGNLVAVDAARATASPDGAVNIVLQAGDSLQVPSFDPTVLVHGAVSFESRVVYRPGASLDYYVQRAGGYSEFADRDRITVTHQNGERASASDFVLFYRRTPTVTPGSTIHVPAVPASERGGFDWGGFLSRSASIASVTATLLLAIAQLR